MGNVAVVTDSNSGITQAQGKELGVSVLPMPFYIGDAEYFEDINLTQEQFYELLKGGADIKTSQPAPEQVTGIWDELLEEKGFDEIVHIPMSSGLSGSCQSAFVLSQDYGGRVQVVNNQRISVTQRRSVLDALELAQAGKSAGEIKDILEREKFKTSIYIMLDTLEYLKKGGRITPAAAAIGTLLKLKPVLQIQGEKLDAFAKARTSAQGRELMISAIKKDIETRIGGFPPEHAVHLQIAYTYDRSRAEDFCGQILSVPEFSGYDIHIDPLSLSVSCHIGPGALAVACSHIIREP